MAGVLHKLLRKPRAPRIITGFNNPQQPNLVAPILHHQPHIGEHKPDDTSTLIPLLGSPNGEKIAFSQSLQIFPSFPFGYYLNPVSPSGIDQSEAEEVGIGDGQTIWADSVKKKRKKKMNKHKYKKLRKRLRRQT
ncbi:hypothetical protein HHK36_007490 [Tetracentron sinense]|uniref:Small ribosomal subunit protein mS38 n=1 Tax=Tetracentron sinense TaxID=13715 RepID=A0A834ZJW1_TETSI|nr:hypothetical protein HHK36_007490 [Tetracentron sinense]